VRSSSLRRPALALAAASSLLLVSACGDDDTAATPTTTASPSPTASVAVVLSEAELEARLLTVDDLPSGFTESTDDDADDAAEDEGLGLTSDDPQCQAVLDRSEESEAESTASVAFESEDSTTLVGEDLESFEQDGAERSLSDARDGVETCDSVRFEDGDGELTVEELTLDEEYGDETVAARFTGQIDLGDGEQIEMTVDVVSVRIVNNVVSVTVFSLGGSAEADASAVDTEEIVRAAVDKFTSAADATASPTATSTTATPGSTTQTPAGGATGGTATPSPTDAASPTATP
jgi:hypothetical protein